MSASPPASHPDIDADLASAPQPWLSKLKCGVTILAITCLMVDLDEALTLPRSIYFRGPIWPRIYEAAFFLITSHPFYLALFIALWLLSSPNRRDPDPPGRVTLRFVMRWCAAIMIAADLSTLFITGHMQGREYVLPPPMAILWRIRTFGLLIATAAACGFCARLSARLRRRNSAAQFTWLIGLPVILLSLPLLQIEFRRESAAMSVVVTAISAAYLWLAVLLLRLRGQLHTASRSTPP